MRSKRTPCRTGPSSLARTKPGKRPSTPWRRSMPAMRRGKRATRTSSRGEDQLPDGTLERVFRARELPRPDVITVSLGCITEGGPQVRILLDEFGHFAAPQACHVLPDKHLAGGDISCADSDGRHPDGSIHCGGRLG